MGQSHSLSVTPELDFMSQVYLMCLDALVSEVIMGIASLGFLWAVFLLPLVFGVPTEETTFGESVASHLPKGCRRCCDPEDLMSSDDTVQAPVSPYVLPEVRPYINITILKGSL
eukprot:XP_006521517.1 PREDICTED: complement C1q tumor necrosis factor-related protein 6 isoform X3 [Mus musculus]